LLDLREILSAKKNTYCIDYKIFSLDVVQVTEVKYPLIGKVLKPEKEYREQLYLKDFHKHKVVHTQTPRKFS
jgi:hypothetical protein